MPCERLTVRQRDLRAALKALKEAGLSVARIEVGKNGIVIVPGEPIVDAKPAIDPEVEAYDRALADPGSGTDEGTLIHERVRDAEI
jgi:hypothetical protein